MNTQSTASIAIVDFGMGNLHSVARALAHVSPKARIEITADPEIDDGDARRGLRVHQPTKLPLVEGTWPAVRGSGSAAMRSARPKALKTVSHW